MVGQAAVRDLRSRRVAIWTFRIGDVFGPEDELAVWICTLAVAFNDAIHSNLVIMDAKKPWESFYAWRVAVSHFSEACLHLERGMEIDAVRKFIEEDAELKAKCSDVLKRYAEIRTLANRVRNQAAFHYPYKTGQKAVARALKELADEQGSMGGTGSTKIKDSRQFYADEVVATLVLNAAGGSEDSYKEAATSFGEAVAAFGRFANVALDAFFMHHQSALTQSDAK